MDEKDQKPITINDILDQMTKTPATPNQGVFSPRPNLSPPQPIPIPTVPPRPIQQEPQAPKLQVEIKLPSLGKTSENKLISPQSQVPTESKLKLSIRTMVSDLEKIRRGQKPLGEEVGKDIKPSLPTPSVSAFLPVAPRPTPKLPSSTQPLSEEHYHPEKIISREKADTNKVKEKEELPAFLGANVPKKVSKSQEEKIEYGLIAKVIGSGMTTGIVSTVGLALVAYFTISYFFFSQEEVIVPTPAPPIISQTPIAEINEINIIFSDVDMLDFQLPLQKESAIPSIKSFINEQVVEKQELQRLNITSQSGNTILFNEILENLTTSFPSELEDFLKTNNIVLVYGQKESFAIDSPSDKRLVFIVEINDADRVLEIMRAWEPTLSNDLEKIFDLDVIKEISSDFLDNERRGIKIRYKNFSLPDRSIDYSIVSSLRGRDYLIITNSRESMYSPADKISGL